MTRPGTLGELRASGWESRPVKEEVRANALARISSGKPLVDGVIGFDDTVLPQLENALLAGHDVIFLGERGQAKTRIIRSLVDLLDEWTPTIAGSEINDDPYAPISQHARLLAAERGLEVRLVTDHDSPEHRNLITLRGTLADGEQVSVSGTLVGVKQSERLVEIDGFDLEIELSPLLILFRYDDVPGVIGRIGNLFGAAGVNIANMTVSRNREGGKALMALSIDSPAPPELMEQLREGMDEAYVIQS